MDKANPVLVQGFRSDLMETEFRGSVSVMEENGAALYELGHTERVTYPRSTLKYFQVLPLLLSGAVEKYGISEAEIAVMCASHNAQPTHLEAVSSILRKIRLKPEHLKCGAHKPLSETAAADLNAACIPPSPMHNNCSGKHAGFLALAKFLGAPLETYLEHDHPVQQQIREVICKLCDRNESDLHAGVDGCSAPNYAMPLRNLALGFARLSAWHLQKDAELGEAIRKMVNAVIEHPFFIAGEGRYCTDLVKAAQGRVIAKLGADGVYAVGLVSRGIGIAIKMDDGATGPQYNVTQILLEKMNILPQDAPGLLENYRNTPILNCNGKAIGQRIPVEEAFRQVPDLRID